MRLSLAVAEMLVASSAAIGSEALLQPSERLSRDVIEAAQFDWKSSGLGYVGVWAHDGASCGLIDSDTSDDGFRIITPTTLTSYASTCSIEQVNKTSDGFVLAGICRGEGESNAQQSSCA